MLRSITRGYGSDKDYSELSPVDADTTVADALRAKFEEPLDPTTLLDCRHINNIDARFPLGRGIDPPPDMFPWRIELRDYRGESLGGTLILASSSEEDTEKWVSVLEEISGEQVLRPLDAGEEEERYPGEKKREENLSPEKLSPKSRKKKLLKERDSSAKLGIGEDRDPSFFAVTVCPDGSKYAGEVSLDTAGVHQGQAGLKPYDWHGHGQLNLVSGAGYEGTFNGDGLNGHGTLNFPSGGIYKGEFLNGKMHGAGTIFEAPKRQAQPFTHSRSRYSDHPWEGKQTWSTMSLADDPRVPGEWITLEQRLSLGVHLPNAAKALYDRRNVADSYKGGFVNGLRHGNGFLVENAEATPIRFVVEYNMGKITSKVDVRTLEKELEPHKLTYHISEMVLATHALVVPNPVRSIEGREPFAFRVDPALPEGLCLDPTSGEITGIANDEQPLTDYRIRAQNGWGATEVTLRILVYEAPFAEGVHLKVYDDGSRYEGGWLDGQWHGQGVMELASGARYEGGFVDGVKGDNMATLRTGSWRDGLCEMVFANGDRYQGDWEDGKRHGYGTMHYVDGTVEQGQWNCGQPGEMELPLNATVRQSISHTHERNHSDIRTRTAEGGRKAERTKSRLPKPTTGPNVGLSVSWGPAFGNAAVAKVAQKVQEVRVAVKEDKKEDKLE
ncbi:hypothetical protein T484DRAFT_1910413, partial [Baffinella frigidus]